MRVCGVLVLAALAAAAQDTIGVSAGAVTCPVMVQSQTTSTLTDPITKVVSSSGSGDSSSSSSSSDSSNRSSSSSSSMDGSAGGDSSADVGNSDGSSGVSTGSTDGASTGSVGGGSAGSAGVATGSSSTGTTPSSTTATPSSTTKTPSTTTATPSTTTGTPSTTTGSSTGSATGSSDSAGTTRRLQTTTTTGTVSAGSTTGTTTTTTSPSTTGSSTTGTTTTTTPSTGTTTTSSSTGSGSVGSSAGSSSTSTSDNDVMTCDSTFYSQWDTFGLTCGGSSLDVDSAVAATSCVIYSGSVGSTSGSTCVSICSFPACTNSAWVYGADNGLASSVYDGLELDSFMNSTIIAALEERSSTVSTFLSNSTMTSDDQCSYSSEASFSSCTCSAMLVSSSNATDAEKKQQREQDEADGVITKDNTTTSGTVVATTSKSIAGVTVVVSSIAAIASTVAGTTSTATASVAMAGANAAVTTVELCQFAVFINQLDLDGKSSALSLFGKQMAPANFMFLPFGKFDEDKDEDDDGSSSGSGSDSSSSSSSGSDSSTRRRLSSDSGSSGSSGSTSSSSLTGIAKYARQIGIKESMLFIVTLAGVICVMAGVVALFGIGYVIAGFFMPREEFLTKFFDKMIGLEILVAILSQYTIGVTGTYQIYYSFKNDNPTDPKCILAMVALLGLACGIILYGYVVVKKHEAEIADVGTVQHLKKTVNMRYGPFYEEYKYKNRFFFTAKMFVALATGVVTGFVGISSTIQVSIVLGINVIFFFYLEIQAPHHSKFVQTATSFVSIMKIAVLVLTFFLISAAASDGFPTELQNGISLAIVGLNLFALVLLMIRSLYMFWKKYQLQREARFDDEEQTAQDYFKDETPQQAKDRQLTNATHQAGGLQPQQSQQSLNPYVQGNQAYDYDNNGDEIRLRSGTHMQEQVEVGNYQQQQQVGEYQQQAAPQQTYDVNRHTAANYYANDPRASAAHRRNDVVEL